MDETVELLLLLLLLLLLQKQEESFCGCVGSGTHFLLRVPPFLLSSQSFLEMAIFNLISFHFSTSLPLFYSLLRRGFMEGFPWTHHSAYLMGLTGSGHSYRKPIFINGPSSEARPYNIGTKKI